MSRHKGQTESGGIHGKAVYSLLSVASREVKRLVPGRGAINKVSAAWAGKECSAHC